MPILLVLFILLVIFIMYEESNQAVFFVVTVTAFAALITFLPPLSKCLQNEKGIHKWKHLGIYILFAVIIIVYIGYAFYEAYYKNPKTNDKSNETPGEMDKVTPEKSSSTL